MEVTVEQAEGLERRVRVQVPEARIKGEVDKRLGDMARSARIPGFRPGKAPVRVIAQRYGRQVRDEVVGEVVRESFVDALTQQQLRPAGQPQIEPLDAEPGNGLAYTAVFDVLPEITLPDFSSLVVRRPQAEVADADVDSMLETLRRQRQTWEAVERAAREGDTVVAAVEGRIDGEVVERAGGPAMRIELGSGHMIPGFEDGLIGVVKGDRRDLDLEFPADYHVDEVAGTPVACTGEVSAVEEERLPDLDEQLAESFGVKEGGIEAFRVEVRGNMERELADALRARLKERTMDVLLEATPLELPRSLVDEEIERAMQQRRSEMAQYGIDGSQIELDARLFGESARRRVALGLVLAELIKSQGMQADPQRVRERVESIASTYEQPEQVVSWVYGEASRIEPIQSAVLEDQVVEWVLEQARVEDQQSSFDELMNHGQTSPAA